MLITQEEYDSIFRGYYINGVAVRDNGYVYLTLREKRDDVDPVIEERLARKKFVAHFHDKPLGRQWGENGYEGLDTIYSAAATVPLSQYVGVDTRGVVCALGSGFGKLEENIPGKLAIFNSRAIGGRVYVAGSGRYVARRVDRNRWEALEKGIIVPTGDERIFSAGFRRIDGFSESDIYAGGGEGDLWHFDGDKWRQISFPTNMSIESICCGQDGSVYIGSLKGTVFKGRDDQWKMIHEGKLSLPFRQMVWFQDRVWATSDYGVWQIVNDEVVEPELPPEVRECVGYISCTDEILVLAGHFGAARLENGRWDVLVSCTHDEDEDEDEGYL